MTELKYFVNCEVGVLVVPIVRRENPLQLDRIVQAEPGWLPSPQQIDMSVCHVGRHHDFDCVKLLSRHRSPHRPSSCYCHHRMCSGRMGRPLSLRLVWEDDVLWMVRLSPSEKVVLGG